MAAVAADPVGHADPGSEASPRTRAAGRPVAVGAADVGAPWLQQERRVRTLKGSYLQTTRDT